MLATAKSPRVGEDKISFRGLSERRSSDRYVFPGVSDEADTIAGVHDRIAANSDNNDVVGQADVIDNFAPHVHQLAQDFAGLDHFASFAGSTE